MKVYLIDGTYELFRHYYALPKMLDASGQEVAAVRGVLASVLGMVQEGATHLAVATDHVIESFRNDLWPGYKDGSAIEPDLASQFPLLEEALVALGVVVWPMMEFEADDALASGARLARQDKRVEQVIICTPDKDLAQCVVGKEIVQLDRRKKLTRDADGVKQKFGVMPTTIPDYLALVGDAADGYPGLAGWGAKSSAAVLSRYGHLEAIPEDWRKWNVDVANPKTLSNTLREDWQKVMLFKDLATLRDDMILFDSVDELHWTNATDAFPLLAARLDAAVYRDRDRDKDKDKSSARKR